MNEFQFCLEKKMSSIPMTDSYDILAFVYLETLTSVFTCSLWWPDPTAQPRGAPLPPCHSLPSPPAPLAAGLPPEITITHTISKSHPNVTLIKGANRASHSPVCWWQLAACWEPRSSVGYPPTLKTEPPLASRFPTAGSSNGSLDRKRTGKIMNT